MSSVKTVLMNMLKKNKNVYLYMDEEYRDDDEIFLACLNSNWGSCRPLKTTSDRIKDNKELVIKALKRGCTFKHASQRLRRDRDMCFEACLINSQSYYYILSHDWCDGCFEKDLFRKGIHIHLQPELQENKEFMIEALKNNPECIYKCRDFVKDDEEIMKAAIISDNCQYLRIYNQMSTRLKMKKDLAILALKQLLKIKKRASWWTFQSCLQYMYHFADDIDICKLIVQLHVNDLELVSARLSDDFEFVTFVIKSQTWRKAFWLTSFWKYISFRLQKKKEIQLLFAQCSPNDNSLWQILQNEFPEKDVIIAALKRNSNAISEAIEKISSLDYMSRLEALREDDEIKEIIKETDAANKIRNWWRNFKNRSFKLAVYAIIRLKKEEEKCKKIMNPKRLLDKTENPEEFWKLQNEMETEKSPLIDFIYKIKKRKFN